MRALTKKDWLNLTPGTLVAWNPAPRPTADWAWLMFIEHVPDGATNHLLMANFVDVTNPSDQGLWIFDGSHYFPVGKVNK